MVTFDQLDVSKRIFWKRQLIAPSKATGLRIKKVIRRFGNRIFRISHSIMNFQLSIGQLPTRLVYFSVIGRTRHTTSAWRSIHIIEFVLFAKLLNIEPFHVLVVVYDSVIYQLKWKNVFALLCGSSLSYWLLFCCWISFLRDFFIVFYFILTSGYCWLVLAHLMRVNRKHCHCPVSINVPIDRQSWSFCLRLDHCVCYRSWLVAAIVLVNKIQ